MISLLIAGPCVCSRLDLSDYTSFGRIVKVQSLQEQLAGAAAGQAAANTLRQAAAAGSHPERRD
jgi:hypothetical protein